MTTRTMTCSEAAHWEEALDQAEQRGYWNCHHDEDVAEKNRRRLRRKWRRYRRLAAQSWNAYCGPTVTGFMLGLAFSYVLVCVLTCWTLAMK